jgi:hypothetical protein
MQPPQGLHIASVMKRCSGYVTCCSSYESILYPPFIISYITIKDVLKEPCNGIKEISVDMLCVIQHIYIVYNQALIIIGPDFAVMNALPLLLSYM